MPLTLITMMAFWAESRERSSRDGMAYGSKVDNESQMIQNTVLSTTVGSVKFLHEVLWIILASLWIVDRHVR